MDVQAIGDAEETIPPELQLQHIRCDCLDNAYEAHDEAQDVHNIHAR
jgi:hypothetical protein